LLYVITTISNNDQYFKFAVSRFPLLRAQPQCAAAHPTQRFQARGCTRARRGVCGGVLLHVGPCECHARIALNDSLLCCAF